MSKSWIAMLGLALLATFPATPAAEPGLTKDGFPKFKMQEIEKTLKVGYAVLLEDINGDKKPDIVVVDTTRIVWYENPTWKRRTITEGKTAPDNVCATTIDIDGDGLPELVVGAAWKPFDTQKPGTLQWFKRGKSLDDEWTMHSIPCDEPTVHRIRTLDHDGDGHPEIVHVPLMGRDSTKAKNWMDGRPVRIIAYQIPKNPEKPENWKPKVISEELRVVHGFAPVHHKDKNGLLTASYEGVTFFRHEGEKWTPIRVSEGNQDHPDSNRGASEVKPGFLHEKGKKTSWVIGTVEPWHGNQIVVYPEPATKSDQVKRIVIDDQLRWGHVVWFADLDGDGSEELIAGVRDDPNPKLGDKFTERKGVRIYKSADCTGEKWTRHILEDGGVACEDLAARDLDGDGKIDIVAVGRATGNIRIYWNQGK